MKFIGFNFTKVNAERFSDDLNGLNLNNKMDISKIESMDSKDNNKRVIKLSFKYEIDYNPNFAKINLSGEVFVLVDSELAEKITKQWKEDKKSLDEDFRVFAFNILLRKCNLKALELEDEMNLPIHLPLPSVKRGDSLEEKKE
ncbi:MAG: hypothetical protein PVJ67_03225 [Candidatus Pacearchaeota archaeon]|jgi:hypothetical protein